MPVFDCGGVISSTSFATANTFGANDRPSNVDVGDIDGDGLVDAITANSSPVSSPDNFSVYLNTSSLGTISFATKVDFAANAYPTGIAAGDIDGDSKLDVVVVNKDANNISIYRNTSTQGAVSFAAKIDVATSGTPQRVSIGNITDDGRPEIVVSTNTGVDIFSNTSSVGAISVAAKVSISTGSQAKELAIGDVDGDGLADVVVVNRLSNTVSILRNISTSVISFDTKVDYATGNGPHGVDIADLDGMAS